MIVLIVLYALATLVLVAHGLRLLGLSIGRLTTTPEAEAEAPEVWPHVCVQLPVYNEPEVVTRAIAALAALDYPSMELQVLDDSTDITSERAARAVRRLVASGVRAAHIQREHREGYKAGALAEGMKQTDAPLFAIFDADFLPEPDTLRRLVAPLAEDPDRAFAQARWAHINREDRLLTRAQGALMDLHFAVEQTGRQRLGRFLPFNGTAGVWRREAIEQAGGWRGDTLAEDLDLSIRAWTGGARGHLVEGVAVPAELPPTMGAWQKQQARWAEGMAAVVRLHARRILSADQPLALRLRALLAVSASLSFPALLTMIVLHPVLALLHTLGAGPTDTVFAALSVGWLGLFGAVVAHMTAQHAVGARGLDGTPRSLWRRASDLVLGLAAPVALAMTGTRAVGRGLAGKRSAFARTPKGGVHEGAPVSRADVSLAIYSLAGALALTALGAWVPLLFQGLFAMTLVLGAWGQNEKQPELAPAVIPVGN